MMKQRTHLLTLTAVGLLTLLAFALRAHHLDHFSFWIDEALTSLRASQNAIDIIAGRTFIQEAISQDTHPPLYYLLVAGTRQLWGTSDYAFRYFSLLWGVLLVPLLFQLGRALFNWRVGLVTALLVAINPLHIWYSQEARMYTLLVWLGTLGTYLLVRALFAPRAQVWRWLRLYLLVAGLMLYTHYTAVFLIFVHALFWAWQLWRLGYHKLIFAGLIFNLLATIPLLPLTIPRLFTGAETAYTYLPPTVILADIIGGFSMGLTAPDPAGRWLWWAYLFLLSWSIWVTTRQRHGRVTFLILFSYLLATAIGVSVISLLKPMYLGVRHIMLSSPAFLLFLAVGLVSNPLPSKQLNRTMQLLGWIIVLCGSLAAGWNLYTNPTNRDHIRQMVTYIEAQALEGDLVLYHDAILMLVHWHYAEREDLVVTAIPVYPHLADENTTSQLTELTLHHERVWFLPAPPIDGRDPQNLVLNWVAENWHLIGTYSLPAYSTLLKVEAYRTNSAQVDTLPVSKTPLFLGTTPILQGYDVPTEQAEANLWFDLFWQGAEPTPAERLIFILTGPDGRAWVQESSPLWLFAEPWPTIGYSRTTYRLPLPRGLPAGEYQLAVQGWDESRQSALGEAQAIASITIAPTQVDGLRPRQGLWAGDNLTLAEVVPYATAVKLGHTLPVHLLWVGGSNEENLLPTAVRYTVQLVAPDGQVVWEKTSQPGADWLTAWPAQAWVADFLALSIPATAPVGKYELRWQVQEGAEQKIVPLRLWWQPALFARDWVTLGHIQVEPWPFVTPAGMPPPSQPHTAQFGEFARLRGYDLAQTSDQLDLTLQWQVTQTTPVNYKIFIHLLDTTTGQPIRQRDWFPANGLRPTQGWRTGEIILDPHTLDLRDVPPGVYDLNIGFYEENGFARPAVTQEGVLLSNGQLTLQQVHVGESIRSTLIFLISED